MAPVIPVSIKTVSFVGTYLRLDGTPLQGTVTFHAPTVILAQPSNLALSGDVTVQIQPDGTISGTLLACDDPTISPTGFTYQVTETFVGAPGRTYNVTLSYLAAQPIDLLELSPGSPNQGNYIYVAGPAGPAGPVGPTGATGATGAAGATGATGPGVPTGGSAGQVLYKNSVTTYDATWKNLAESDITNLTADLAARLQLSGGTMTGSLNSTQATAGTVGYASKVAGDTNSRFVNNTDGLMSWGPGTATQDVNLYRGGAGTLKTDNSLTVLTRLGVGQAAPAATTVGITTTTQNNGIRLVNTNAAGNESTSSLFSVAQTPASIAVGCDVNGDTQNRWQVEHDGTMTWGSGTANGDTTLYRSAVGVLRTDNSVSVGQSLSVAAGFGLSRTIVSNTAYTVLPTDARICYVGSLTAARVVTLPTASTMSGQALVIKDETGSCSATNTITVTPATGAIDGAANKVINTAYGVLRLYAAGTNWYTA